MKTDRNNKTIVNEQICSAIKIMEKQASNELSEKVERLTADFREGMITTGQFISEMEMLRARNKELMIQIIEAEQVLLALRNAQHMLSK